jgi:signal transduction histidine kinase
MVARRSPAAEADRLKQLVEVGIRITAERSLDAVLQAVADCARELTGARYGALGVLDLAATGLSRFITSGITAEQAQQIGAPPTGKGVLGLLISEPKSVRIDDLSRHPRAHGFPPGHPPMTSFLGVPIMGRKGPIGNLYLTDKLRAKRFTAEDETIATLLAAQAAVALENASLHEGSQRLIQEVKAMQVARDRFFAMINHELRNALTAVYGWADLLLRKLGPEPPRSAREIYESAERTLALLNDLLDLSRLEAERLRPTLRSSDAATLVTDAIAALEPSAAKRAIRIEAIGSGEPVPCQTDPQRVRQILINLLSNAVRLSPAEGVVTVALRAGDERLRFDVIDRGPGIPAAEQALIFEAFARAGASDERGTGLGLTLSRQLARLLGGDLRVISEVAAGATFTLDVPRWYGPS